MVLYKIVDNIYIYMYKSKLLYMIIMILNTEITIVDWQYKTIAKLETSYFKLHDNTKLYTISITIH